MESALGEPQGHLPAYPRRWAGDQGVTHVGHGIGR
jgi:hypothetical protein